MELERMRTVLAEKVMEWFKAEHADYNEPVWCKQKNYIVEYQSTWQPDVNGLQAWTVIEKMRELGWEFGLIWDDRDVTATFKLGWGSYDAIVEGAGLADVCYAISLAAARAMGATDG